MNWEIKKTSETPLKKEFYIDNPETSLKKIDFNIITNNNNINDMNNNTRKHLNNDLLVDIVSLLMTMQIRDKKNGRNVYTTTDKKLQSGSNLEDLG